MIKVSINFYTFAVALFLISFQLFMFLYHLSCQAILRSYGSEVEHFLGKEEVAGSSPAMSSMVLEKLDINLS